MCFLVSRRELPGDAKHLTGLKLITDSAGGMSTTYSGLYLGEKVFVKRLKSLGDEHQRKQFRYEIDTLSLISSHNVVELLTHFTAPEPTLIFDWCDGGDLSVCWKSRGGVESVPWSERLVALKQIADGMIAIHSCITGMTQARTWGERLISHSNLLLM